MANPICSRCSKEYRPSENGVIVAYHQSGGNIFKLTDADEYECSLCHHKIIIGFAEVSTHRSGAGETGLRGEKLNENFEAALEAAKPYLRHCW